jgi:uncharacterized protein (TIGR02145 family)
MILNLIIMKKNIPIRIITLLSVGVIIMLVNDCTSDILKPTDDLNSKSNGYELKKADLYHPGPVAHDIDGNKYRSVRIGTQIWMAENLKVTHYSNGDAIPNITGTRQWSDLSTGAYCDYANDPNYSYTYGKLYNWYSVDDSRNIAPKGWHVPSDAEWRTLILFLDPNARIPTYDNAVESYIAGGKLKENGNSHWNNPNTGASNEVGFTALPGGVRDDLGGYFQIGYFGQWWSSTSVVYTIFAWSRFIRWDSGNLYGSQHQHKTWGLSVRCIKD